MIWHLIIIKYVHETLEFFFALSPTLRLLRLLFNCLFYDFSELWDFSNFSILQKELDHSVLKQNVYPLCPFCLITKILAFLHIFVECLKNWLERCNIQLEVFAFINVVLQVLINPIN